jgi:hypothetical protein
MELMARVSAKIENEDRTYEFTFPNGANASETLQALVDIHKKIVEMAQKNTESESEENSEEEVEQESDDEQKS